MKVFEAHLLESVAWDATLAIQQATRSLQDQMLGSGGLYMNIRVEARLQNHIWHVVFEQIEDKPDAPL